MSRLYCKMCNDEAKRLGIDEGILPASTALRPEFKERLCDTCYEQRKTQVAQEYEQFCTTNATQSAAAGGTRTVVKHEAKRACDQKQSKASKKPHVPRKRACEDCKNKTPEYEVELRMNRQNLPIGYLCVGCWNLHQSKVLRSLADYHKREANLFFQKIQQQQSLPVAGSRSTAGGSGSAAGGSGSAAGGSCSKRTLERGLSMYKDYKVASNLGGGQKHDEPEAGKTKETVLVELTRGTSRIA